MFDRKMALFLTMVSVVFLALWTYSALRAPSPPAEVRSLFPDSFWQSSRQYHRQTYLLFAASTALSFIFLALAAGPLARLASPFLGRGAGSWSLYAVLVGTLLALFHLPLSFYRGHYLEKVFGFSTQSAASWFADYFKSLGLEVLFLGAAFFGLYWAIHLFPRGWWAAAALAAFLFTAGLSFLGPVLIDPLFNRFEPLQDRELKERIIRITDAAGLEVGEVLVMDASRRTTKANAYFAGIGRTRRVVLYDNLLKNFTPDEIELVIAHEVGHWKHNHIIKGVLLGGLGFLAAFYLVFLALPGLSSRPGPQAVAAVWLMVSLVLFAASPLQSYVSRSFEFQADREMLALSDLDREWTRAQLRFARENLSDVYPHPFIYWFSYTHPTALERIALAEE